MNERNELRKKALALRDSLSDQDKRLNSIKIKDKILGLAEVEQAENIFVYVDFRSEVQTRELIEKLMTMGKKISVPVTHVREKRMDAILIKNLEEDLVPGYCDIPEPRKILQETSVTDPQNIDIVIIPGSVFDDRGGRMGYGGGYYDRFLEKIPSAIRIGIAHEIQKVERVPLEPHDELLDYVITEEKVVKTGRIL